MKCREFGGRAHERLDAGGRAAVSRMSASFMTTTSFACSRATISLRRARAEMSTPFHELASTPGAPPSAVVGTSGSSAERFAFATVNAFNAPVLQVRQRRRDGRQHELHGPRRRSMSAGDAPL